MENFITIVTTCKNRLDHLKRSLPQMVKQPNANVTVVDYGCEQGTSEWVNLNYPEVKLVRVSDDDGWNASRARNLGAKLVDSQWLFFIDADAVLQGDIVGWLTENHCDADLYLPLPRKLNSMGSCIIRTEIFRSIGGYDEAFRGWGGEDTDLYDRVKAENCLIKGYPSSLIEMIPHGDDSRAFGQDYDQLDTMNSALRVELLYRTIKADIKKLTGIEPKLSERELLMKDIKKSVKRYEETKEDKDAIFRINLNIGLSTYQKRNFNRVLIYRLNNPDHKIN